MLNKKAFSLMELIFMIVVMGIIASVALPKLMGTKTNAVVSSLKQDISTVTTSIQSYYLVNNKIDKISDAVNLNSSTWNITDKELKYLDGSELCVTIKVELNKLDLIVNESAGEVCKKLVDSGIVTTTYTLQ